MPKDKSIRDPVHNFIVVPEKYKLLNLIDNEFIQRLRWISQTPLEQFVYPGGTNTRFEHSLGCMYLAGIAAKTLWSFSDNNKVFSPVREFLKEAGSSRDTFIKSAMITGLLHDVGHSPFSHIVEFVSDYDHEKVGYFIAKHLLKKHKKCKKWVLDALDKDKPLKDINPVSSVLRTLIDGPIDIDKGDYLLRDSYHCGVTYGNYGQHRIWRNLAIVGGDEGKPVVGITEKAAHEAYHLLVSRFHMYKSVYQHHTRAKTDALLRFAFKFSALHDSSGEIFIPVKDESFFLNDNKKREFLFWNDGAVLNSLNKMKVSGSSDVLRDILDKILKRKLPIESKIFSTITKKIPSGQKRAVRKQLGKELNTIYEFANKICEKEGKAVAIPYYDILEEPFQGEDLLEIKVYNEKKKASIRLAEFLGFNKEVLLSNALKNESLFYATLVIKMFTYKENGIEILSRYKKRYLKKWKDMEKKMRGIF